MDKCSMFWCIIAILRLGAAATPTINQSITDNCKCPCSLLPRVELTQLPEAANCCRNDNKYMYKCINGYLREAGTSYLIKCTDDNQWAKPNLICKRDPRLPPPPPVTTQKPTTETKSTDPTTSSVDTSTSAAEKESSVDSASDPQSKATVITGDPTIKTQSRTTSSVDTSTSAAEKESSVDSVSDPQSKATVITAEKKSTVSSGRGPQSTATVLTGVSVVVGTLVLFALMGIGLWIHFHNRRLLKNDSQTISEERKPMYPYLDPPSRPNY